MNQDPLLVVQRWFEEVWNQRRVETIDELLVAESVCYGDDGPVRGPEEFRRRQYEPFVAAFPDLWIRVEDTLVEGEQVVVRWHATGTYTGSSDLPGSGSQVDVTGITWIRVSNGKLMEGWQQSGIQLAMQSLQTPPTE
ncbi:ester cyclase [Planctomicrobium sp. SH661]|uniref:ester cyclase n=1 Tax=Planctomicrobium sp. SH661 TaxID=3448124 RepID=UPI003F5AFA3E